MENVKRKKILFLGTQMARAGAQNVLLTQAQWFHEHGYQVVAAFLFDAEGLKEEWRDKFNFSILDFDFWSKNRRLIWNLGKFIKGIFLLFHYIRKGGFTVVETFTPDCNLIGIPLAFLAGVPTRIPTHHGLLGDRPKIFFWLHGKLVNSWLCTKLVVVSKRVKQSAIKLEKIKEEKIKVVLNGIKINDLSLDRHQARKILGWREDALILLSVGRVVEQKGHKFIVEAMPRILEVFLNTEVFIVGEGNLMMMLEEQIAAGGLQDQIKLLGLRKEIDVMLRAADLFVMPSLWEGLPIALLEAMAMESAVVISDVAGIDDVITNGKYGMVVPIGDIDAFADAVIELLGDPDRRKRMGHASREHVLANFSEEVMCQQYEKVFFSK